VSGKMDSNDALASNPFFRRNSSGGRPLIKICGITNVEDARTSAELGADLLGLVFAESSRRVSVETAIAIRRARPDSQLVGVFEDQPLEQVARVSLDCGLDFVQLHGREDVVFCVQLRKLTNLEIVKAFRAGDPGDLYQIQDFAVRHVCALLIDSCHKIGPECGGVEKVAVTGCSAGFGAAVPVHWSIAAEAKKLGKPVFLAGGLTPDTVGSAVEEVGPFGVDVSSGVERAPGKKCEEKIALFIKRTNGKRADGGGACAGDADCAEPGGKHMNPES